MICEQLYHLLLIPILIHELGDVHEKTDEVMQDVLRLKNHVEMLHLMVVKHAMMEI